MASYNCVLHYVLTLPIQSEKREDGRHIPVNPQTHTLSDISWEKVDPF